MIARLLGRLVQAGPAGDLAGPDGLDIIVVANGCTDDTADVAGSFGPPVRVLSIPVASKREALLAGDQAAKDFPRIYVDADVELGAGDIQALGAALGRPGTLACGPGRDLDLAGRPWLVRWYYAVWERLPEVRTGLFGRGVIGLSEAGHARMAGLPPLLADDLVASLAFTPGERVDRSRGQGRGAYPADGPRSAAPPGPRHHGRQPGRGGRGCTGGHGPYPAAGPARDDPGHAADRPAGRGVPRGGRARAAAGGP